MDAKAEEGAAGATQALRPCGERYASLQKDAQQTKMKDIGIYIAAAFFEIFGCFSFWNYFKLNQCSYWLLPGILALIVFASLLTKVQTEFAGRAYAIYGGIYIVASLLWLYFAEHQTPDKWDIVGAGVCLAGAFIILFMPR